MKDRSYFFYLHSIPIILWMIAFSFRNHVDPYFETIPFGMSNDVFSVIILVLFTILLYFPVYFVTSQLNKWIAHPHTISEVDSLRFFQRKLLEKELEKEKFEKKEDIKSTKAVSIFNSFVLAISFLSIFLSINRNYPIEKSIETHLVYTSAKYFKLYKSDKKNDVLIIEFVLNNNKLYFEKNEKNLNVANRKYLNIYVQKGFFGHKFIKDID